MLLLSSYVLFLICPIFPPIILYSEIMDILESLTTIVKNKFKDGDPEDVSDFNGANSKANPPNKLSIEKNLVMNLVMIRK